MKYRFTTNHVLQKVISTNSIEKAHLCLQSMYFKHYALDFSWRLLLLIIVLYYFTKI